MNSWTLTNSPYIWFLKFFKGWIRKNQGIHPSYNFCDFPSKWQFRLGNENFENLSEYSLYIFNIPNYQIRRSDQGSLFRFLRDGPVVREFLILWLTFRRLSKSNDMVAIKCSEKIRKSWKFRLFWRNVFYSIHSHFLDFWTW